MKLLLWSFSHSVCVSVFRKNVKASAVCRFSLSDVQEAFQGPYMEKQDSGSEWKEYTGKIPDPRPGTVNTRALLPVFLNTTMTHKNDSLHLVLQGFTPKKTDPKIH